MNRCGKTWCGEHTTCFDCIVATEKERNMSKTDPIYRQAVELLLAINSKQWPGRGVTPASTTSGVLDQIDHLTAHMRAINMSEAITRQIEGEPLTRPTAVSLVDQWARDWLFADGPHWGDDIFWRNAMIIAQKIDEAYTGA